MTAGLMWIDASAGVAGDMLLGALVDAGVPLTTLQAAVEAVVPGSVRLRSTDVTRAGLHATKVDVDVLVDDPPHRTWTTIRAALHAADLDEPVRTAALEVFARLAEAEGQVHGVRPEDVHFHEVGALDAIADVVGTCAGVHALGVTTSLVSPVALGSGTITAHHGVLPVPPPAVLALSRGWDVLAGGGGELATPTGLALVTGLAERSSALPPMRVERIGVGAGTRDVPGRANVVRIAVGTPSSPSDRKIADDAAGSAAGVWGTQEHVLLEANVDDLDPRLWPDVVATLLAAGAADAWLTPVLMKKGRPAHTLHVLAEPHLVAPLGDLVLQHTTTLGVRSTAVRRDVLPRAWVHVTTPHGDVRVKVGHRAGRIRQAMPEYDDVRAVAAATGLPVRQVLSAAHAGAAHAGLVVGGTWPVPGSDDGAD
ncbi:nickel pincer cofactor biosynthesis protein LarC [uncultured Cellulomonas sp.]|uniref:nickel pincer cofactor biosynthesis protein LarC n=1 Tax=uncultured Cellulomonas sp. TaxID=189682 RepID=UPI002610D77F|nr:nickel pincer cofactor biosynthesis protein LarC [uncultured Cellulomonas sp.]